MAEVVCLGEALIDFVATESGVGVGESEGFVRAPGGAPANVAVGVARLGRTSAFLGKVGDDPFGRFLAQTFAEAGADTDGMVFSPEYRTGLAFVSLTAEGERDFCFFRNPSADITYTPEELDRKRLESGRIFHYGSITTIEEPARTTTDAAIALAKAAGLLLSYDPNLRPPLWADLKTARKGILRVLPSADIVKVSEEELLFLLDESAVLPDTPPSEEETARAATRFLEEYGSVALLAVTRGAKGCLWRTRTGAQGSLPGLRVPVVDTTGAGDGFVAALLVGLLERRRTQISALPASELERLFAAANRVGALTTTKKGAIPALPTAEEAASFMEIG